MNGPLPLAIKFFKAKWHAPSCPKAHIFPKFLLPSDSIIEDPLSLSLSHLSTFQMYKAKTILREGPLQYNTRVIKI